MIKINASQDDRGTDTIIQRQAILELQKRGYITLEQLRYCLNKLGWNI